MSARLLCSIGLHRWEAFYGVDFALVDGREVAIPASTGTVVWRCARDCGVPDRFYDVWHRVTGDAESPIEARDLNTYAAQCHADNAKWWEREDGTPLERNKGELLMLMVSEIAEAMEGERKGLMDEKLPHRLMAEVELADALIRIFDYAAAFGYDLEGAYQEKRAFNASREDHTHEARALAEGKKW